MAQHDFNIANQVPANLRSDLNNALSAIATNNSGASAPSTTYANQWWYDTTNDLLKIRNEADTAWITLGELNQASGVWKPYVNGKQIADFLDEDDMASDSATAVPSQQSVKAYVDTMGGNQSGSAPIYGVRAWGKFDGQSSASPTVLASGNVASFTRAGTGLYTVAFTTAMSDANYSVQLTSGYNGTPLNTTQRDLVVYDQLTTGFKISVTDASNNTYQDADYVHMTVIR